MLILFTSEENCESEKHRLIHFFKNGLGILHVRKPEMTEKELQHWLSQFNEQYLKKMVLHQHHHLAEAFPVKGIHLKEKFRNTCKALDDYIEHFQVKGFTVSSSFHNSEEVKREASAFDYVFLSPVFTSISKKDYAGHHFDVKNLPQKVIALGGIEAGKISKAKALGYKGVAVLGAVWLTEKSNQAFNEIHKAYSNVYE